MTTLTALARSGTVLQPGPVRRSFLLGFFGTLAIGMMLFFTISIAVGLVAAGKIMPGVRVAGIEVGGLDRASAQARLHAELPPLTEGGLSLSIDGTEVELPYAELGRAYQLDGMLDAAYGVARSGDLVADAVARVRLLVQPSTIGAAASASDHAALEATVRNLVARFGVSPTDASVSLVGAGYTVSPAVDGARLDSDALTRALAMAVADLGTSGTVELSTIRLEPEITTAEAEAAAEQARRMVEMPLAVRAGGASHPLDMAAIAALVSFEATADGGYAPTLDASGIAALIEPLAADVATEPKNAGFEWGANGITGVTPAVEGLELDVQASVATVVETIEARGRSLVRRSVPLAVAVTAPALTTQVAQAAAPQMQRLSTWTTYYVAGEGNYWNANIHIPAWDLDKMVLAPGEWFSFWNDIGPVTVERGYGYGGVIIGGRSVANGALAGGICSTSTTLFNAAMRSGLEIGDRMNHSYYIERYPVGLDATVLKTDTWAQDMTFRNDTANPLVIRSYTGNGWVRFDIWGVPDGRTVRLSAPTTSNHRTAVETTVVNRSLAPGTSKRVEYPHNGFDAVVTRWVYDGQGELLHENVWTSHYRTVNGITEVGPDKKPKPDNDDPPDDEA